LFSAIALLSGLAKLAAITLVCGIPRSAARDRRLDQRAWVVSITKCRCPSATAVQPDKRDHPEKKREGSAILTGSPPTAVITVWIVFEHFAAYQRRAGKIEGEVGLLLVRRRNEVFERTRSRVIAPHLCIVRSSASRTAADSSGCLFCYLADKHRERRQGLRPRRLKIGGHAWAECVSNSSPKLGFCGFLEEEICGTAKQADRLPPSSC
jgi:hypothetical protein